MRHRQCNRNAQVKDLGKNHTHSNGYVNRNGKDHAHDLIVTVKVPLNGHVSFNKLQY